MPKLTLPAPARCFKGLLVMVLSPPLPPLVSREDNARSTSANSSPMASVYAVCQALKSCTSLDRPLSVGGSTNGVGSTGSTVAFGVAAGRNVAMLAAGGNMASDVAAGGNVATSKRVPLKMIGGRVQSLGVYQALRVLGDPLDVAQKRAFVSLTFML